MKKRYLNYFEIDIIKKLLYVSIIIPLLIVSSCTGIDNIGLEKHTGFIELPFPSNNFKPSQIIEVYSKPKKVVVTHQPSTNWEMLNTSPGWDISTSTTNDLKSSLSTEISKVLIGEYDYASKENIIVEFTNTKTSMIQTSTIYSILKKELKDNSDLNEQITEYVKTGTHFDVITATLSANISFKLVNNSNVIVDLDTEMLEKINSQFDANFTKEVKSNRIITGKNLVIGFHKDPKMIKSILKRINSNN